ncbi:hypothetical protein ES703_112465 [subsurface metagenome]
MYNDWTPWQLTHRESVLRTVETGQMNQLEHVDTISRMAAGQGAEDGPAPASMPAPTKAYGQFYVPYVGERGAPRTPAAEPK